jgi:hypothetical protein
MEFERMEAWVLRSMFGVSGAFPVVALRSLAGIHSWFTVLNLEKLRVLLRLLECPPGSTVRLQLAVELEHYHRDSIPAFARKQLWWHGVDILLRLMDAGTTPDVRAKEPLCPQSFRLWGHHAALHPHTNLQLTPEFGRMCKRVLFALESRFRHAELASYVSLNGLDDILDTPNMAPMVIDHRTHAAHLRVLASGGVLQLFSHEFYNLEACPHCNSPGTFTVPHLFRDCAAFEGSRARYWAEARDVAIAEKVLGADHAPDSNVMDHRHNWYLVTMGAAVPHTFIALKLSNQSHFARPSGASASKHLRLATTPYRRILAITGNLVVHVVLSTWHTLKHKLEADSLVWKPNSGVRRRPVNPLELFQVTPGLEDYPAPAPAADPRGYTLLPGVVNAAPAPRESQQ